MHTDLDVMDFDGMLDTRASRWVGVVERKGSGGNVIVLHYSIFVLYTDSHLLNAMSEIAKLKSAQRTKGVNRRRQVVNHQSCKG